MKIINIINILFVVLITLTANCVYACDASKYGPHSEALCDCKAGKVIGDDIYDCFAKEILPYTDGLQFLRKRDGEYGVELIEITGPCDKDAHMPYSGCLCNCRENKNIGDDIYGCYVQCLDAYSGYDQFLKDFGLAYGVRFKDGKLLVTSSIQLIVKNFDNTLNIKEWGVI